MAEINDFLSPNAEKQIKAYETTIDKLVKQYGQLDKAIAALNREQAKENKNVKTLTTRQKEAQKLRNGLRSTIAKQEQAESKLNKELIKSKVALQEQTRALKEQAKRDLGIKKRSGLFNSVTKSILASLTVIGALTKAMELVWKEISRTAEFQRKWQQGINATRAAMDVLTGSVKEAVNGNGGFKDFNKRIDEAIARSIELTRALQMLTINQAGLIKKSNELRLVEELYRSVADDATLSFQRRAEANEKAFEAQKKRVNREVELNKEAFDIEVNIQAEQKKQGLQKTTEQLTRLATLRNAYDNSRAERKKIDLQYNKFKRELDLDDFEQELDFIFDVADKRKTANEKIINDERVVFTERKKLFNETTALLDDSFKDQIDLFNEFNDVSIDTNKLLNLNNKESFEYARSLGMSERATNRLLEVIRERIAASSDLLEIQKDLREEETKINTDFAEKTKANGELQLTINQDILKQREEQLLKTLKFEEDETQKSEDRKKAVREKALEEVINLSNLGFDLKQSYLDRELDALQTNYDAQIQAADGNAEKQEALARELAQKQYEINLEQAKAEKTQALFNIAISTAVGVAKALEAGPAGALLAGVNAAAGAIQTALVLAQPLPTPPQFATGTEYSPSTFIAGEKGRELMITKDGQAFLTPNSASLYTGMEGTQILPNAQTESILSSVGMANAGAIDTKQLSDKLDAINDTAKRFPEEIRRLTNPNVTRLGKGSRMSNRANKMRN